MRPDHEAAKRARDDGMQRAADHADAINPRWKDAAYTFLAAYARAHDVFTSEDVRAAAERSGISTDVPKAWGPIFRNAARDGVICRDGYGVALQRHYSPCPRWRSLLRNQAA